MPNFNVDNVREVFNEGRNVQRQRDEEVRVAFFVDPTASPEQIAALRTAFVPELPTGLIHVERLSESGLVTVLPTTDLAVVVCGDNNRALSACVRKVLAADVSCVAVCESALDAPKVGSSLEARGRYGVVASSQTKHMCLRLAQWIVEHSDKSVAFAANFAFVRDAMANKMVDDVSFTNGALGALKVIPGGDFAAMVMNEAKLALDVSALYGKPLSAARAAELVWVVGAGLCVRGVMRQISGHVPVADWLLRGVAAWAGTELIGQAIVTRFQSDEEFMVMVERIVARAAQAFANATGLTIPQTQAQGGGAVVPERKLLEQA